MPKKDKYHEAAKEALINDGWTITDDPYYIKVLGTKYPADLGAEKIIAEKGKQKIVVEVKSFLKTSVINEFHIALGQFLNYELGLRRLKSDRQVYLAIPRVALYRIENKPILMEAIKEYSMQIIVFDIHKQKIVKWIK